MLFEFEGPQLELQPTNAAVVYRQAYAALAGLSVEETAMLAAADRETLDGRAADFLLRYEPAIREWFRATDLSDCDWGFEPTKEWFDAACAGWPKGRQLTQLARLWVRSMFDRGLAQDAADALGRMFVTARHFGSEGLAMSQMVGWACQKMAIDLASAHLIVLAERVCEEMAARLRSLPPAEDLARAIRREVRLVEAQREQPFTEMKLSDYRTVFQLFCRPGEVEMICRAAGNDEVRLTEMARDATPVYRRIAEILELPPDGAQAGLLALGREYRKTNPYVIYLVRAYEKLRLAEERARVWFTQLQAALAIRVRDRGAWLAATDPATGRPFGYRKFAGGFRLYSPSQQDGQPVLMLTVGDCPQGWWARIWRIFRGD